MVFDGTHALDPYRDCCPFCLDELRRGVPADGKCGHEAMLETYPHLRFNAFDKHTEQELVESAERFARDHRGVELG